MRIQPINSTQYSKNNIYFKSSTSINSSASGRFDNDHNDDNNRKPLPEWARKTMLFTVIFFTLKNEPVVQNFFNSNTVTEEDPDRDEFFEDVQKIRKENGKSAAFYHLNSLYDFEQPKIKVLGEDKFSLDFNLDNQKINLEMKLDKNNKDTISGRFKLGEDSKFIKYKAMFSPDSIEEFKVLLNDGTKSYILGRDYNGELYKIENHKKEVLNTENVEKYEQYLENLETLDDLKFFTNENPLWRKLNYLLLIVLVYAEYKHDKHRKNEKPDKTEL